jgi:predicted NAD/FAD-binding protein
MKIAVIGSGVSGLISAYLLAPHHDVVLFEKNNRIGGHAHTLFVSEDGQDIPVDNGFMVYNPERYPNFIKLLDLLGVSSLETSMSFALTIENVISYRGNFPKGLFADRSNIFNGRFWKLLYEIVRFRLLAKRVLKKEKNLIDTLDEFLTRYRFSKEFANWFLYPMLAAIWSAGDSDDVGEFPALSIFTFMNNHKLLNFKPPIWRTIKGGSIQYVSKIQDFLEKNNTRIVLNSQISGVYRHEDYVMIQTDKGEETFDYVIIATHADVALQLLSDASEEEIKALSQFSYSVNRTVLHKDTNTVPSNKDLVASWNVRSILNASGKTKSLFTYCMNKLQHIHDKYPIFVTLNPDKEIAKHKFYHEEVYEHPIYNFNTLIGQDLIAKLQGARRTLYAGAHLGYGFHEDGIVSAVNAAKKLGVNPPWNIEN